MKKSVLPLGAALVIVAGCSSDDQGVVMGCFGLVNENFPGEDIVTNMFFGGCSPDDVGMQIMERATQAASQNQDALALKCNSDCNLRLAAYIGAHPDADLPLTCQTLFASQCDNLEADVTGLGGGGLAFQAGGPADTRYSLTGQGDADGRQHHHDGAGERHRRRHDEGLSAGHDVRVHALAVRLSLRPRAVHLQRHAGRDRRRSRTRASSPAAGMPGTR